MTPELYFRGGKITPFIKKEHIFSGGEVLIEAVSSSLKAVKGVVIAQHEPLVLVYRLQSSNDIMKLALLKSILDSSFEGHPISLVLPYVPYGRQDKVFNDGEALSLKVFSNILNSLKFRTVTILDPHSPVTEALIDQVKILKQHELFGSNPALLKKIDSPDSVLVSPDIGGNKKTAEIARLFFNNSFIRCDKLRNTGTGEITETIVYADNLRGKVCYVVDDICDGGRTFIEIAKALKLKGAARVELVVSHAIFSAGVTNLLKYIDHIWTTDSFDFSSNLQLDNNYEKQLSVLEITGLLVSK